MPEQLVEEGRKFRKMVSKTSGAGLKKFLLAKSWKMQASNN